MKNKTFLFAAISLLLLLGAAGCEKNEPFLPPTEAQQAIWGEMGIDLLRRNSCTA